MNPDDPILAWRQQGALPALAGSGWTVVFARTAHNRYPALDYLDGSAKSSDPEFAFTNKHLDRLRSLIHTIRTDGLQAIRGSSSYCEFIGKDAAHNMCEFRIIPNRGHRLLCFQQPVRRLIIAHGFRKPGQPETPQQEKTIALGILKEFLGKD